MDHHILLSPHIFCLYFYYEMAITQLFKKINCKPCSNGISIIQRYCTYHSLVVLWIKTWARIAIAFLYDIYHISPHKRVQYNTIKPNCGLRDASSTPWRRRSYTLQAEELHLASVVFRQTTPIFYPVLQGWKQGLCGLHRRPWQNAISTHTQTHRHTHARFIS